MSVNKYVSHVLFKMKNKSHKATSFHCSLGKNITIPLKNDKW